MALAAIDIIRVYNRIVCVTFRVGIAGQNYAEATVAMFAQV